jgi:hypothetical protein
MGRCDSNLCSWLASLQCSDCGSRFDVSGAVKEIARTLRPGGVFMAILEALHFPHLTEKTALEASSDSVKNRAVGTHERSYTPGY